MKIMMAWQKEEVHYPYPHLWDWITEMQARFNGEVLLNELKTMSPYRR
jgi:hypothetical protein